MDTINSSRKIICVKSGVVARFSWYRSRISLPAESKTLNLEISPAPVRSIFTKELDPEGLGEKRTSLPPNGAGGNNGSNKSL